LPRRWIELIQCLDERECRRDQENRKLRGKIPVAANA
jgi:hypothetical protein